MEQAGEMFENAILHWRDCKGIGTALIPSQLNDKVMVLGVLQRIYARSPTYNVVILTNTFQERQDIIEFLTTQESEENNNEFKNIISNKYLKIFTIDFVVKQYADRGCIRSSCCIVYHPDKAYQAILDCLHYSKFKLLIINKLFNNVEDTNAYYKICPILDDFKHNEVEAIRLSTPVEEIRIGVEIPETSEAFNLLNRYNEYITTTLSIFGSFDIMQQVRLGNSQLNISSAQICAQIAQENGWNENLDMNIPFNVEIDKLYNPLNLKERATRTYEIIRNRGQLLSDYDGKLDAILKIIGDNPNKKILIINKRGEFANKVTEFINCSFESNICGNYHDKVDNIPMVDINGLPVYFKSGEHKGERRMMGAQAQKTYNEHLFNKGLIRVISTNNAPDKNLAIDVDIIIITSAQCESIKTYMYRLDKITFNSNTITLYNIYCKNSMEQKLLENKEQALKHTIHNKCEKSVISEENSDFVIVD